MPPALQAKLLRFLQERTIERVGGHKPIPVDIRVVSATNQNLQELIEHGRFRQDLYYRISEGVVDIPPLRDRLEDAALIANKLARDYAKELRSEEHTSELQSLMRNSYAVFCLKKKKNKTKTNTYT